MRGYLRSLNLYNLVAILLPGVALLIILFPLFPRGVKIDPILALVPLIAVGFLIGQAMHSFAVTLDSYRGNKKGMTLHRELFVGLFCSDISESDDPTLQRLAEDFVHAYNREFGSLGTPVHRYIVEDCDPEVRISEFYDDVANEGLSSDRGNSIGKVSLAYTYARSKVHTDGRGRSRVFQSVYAFNRSIAYTLPLMIVTYILYPIIILLNLPEKVATSAGVERIDYQPMIADFVTPPSLVGALGLIIGGALFVMFVRSTGGYRKYYIQYTLADYLVLSQTETGGGENTTRSIHHPTGRRGNQQPSGNGGE